MLSPGPADGGRPERDRVATLTASERLTADGNVLDLAVALVDDVSLVVGNTVPEGHLPGVVEDVLHRVTVAKVGPRPGTRLAQCPLSSWTA